MQKSQLSILVQFKEETHTIAVDVGSNYEQLVRKLMLSPEEVLVFVKGISVPSDKLVEPEEVRIVKIVSGG